MFPHIRRIPCLTRCSRRYLTSESSPQFIKKIFDDQKFFKEWTTSRGSGFSTLYSIKQKEKTGLFRNEALKSPNGLIQFAKVQLDKAKALAEYLLSPNISKSDVVCKMDQLSDTLCRAIDVAEFIRVAHPSSRWVAAAQQTHEMMFEYMNQLNTNVALYRALKTALKEEGTNLSDEEIAVGNYLIKDFERSGIDMDDETRNFFVEITQQISICGSMYTSGAQQLESYWCDVSIEEWASLSPELKSMISKYSMKAGTMPGKSIPLDGHIAYEILTKCSNREIRRRVWIALHSAPKDQIKLLEGFLVLRAALANKLGHSSFGSYQLEEKMARSPSGVMTFLDRLKAELKPRVEKELKELISSNMEHQYVQELTSSLSPGATSSSSSTATLVEELDCFELFSQIKPWDRDYLMNSYKSQFSEPPDISPYLSIGTVMSGLSRLFTSIYNISLLPVKTITGETWDDSQVRKIAVVDNTSNITLGYLYLDFWSPKVLPSHFTIVCSREKSPEEDLANSTHLDDTGTYQLPVISLLCNFTKATEGPFKFGRATPTLLSLDQMETIFHEMGHAMHSMVGRTKLHNLAGTRCSTDFAELPSVLMEFFAKDPRVLREILCHYQTGEPIDPKILSQNQNRRGSLDATESYIQLKMATLDQVLHSENVSRAARSNSFNSTKVYHSVEHNLKVFADEWSTWHGKFPHLFSYGAVYYSYLLDRAIAEKLWSNLFEKDPWNREAGEKYRQCILNWGGTRDPWVMLADALGNEELRSGDEKAMEFIASTEDKTSS